MAVQWQWSDKCGELIIEQTFDGETKEYTKTLYEGNCFLIILNEWDEGESHMYSLYTFFADEKHAKRCLGLEKGYENLWDEGFDTVKKLRINKKKCRNWKKIITLFSQAFDNLEIEIYTEDKDD